LRVVVVAEVSCFARISIITDQAGPWERSEEIHPAVASAGNGLIKPQILGGSFTGIWRCLVTIGYPDQTRAGKVN